MEFRSIHPESGRIFWSVIQKQQWHSPGNLCARAALAGSTAGWSMPSTGTMCATDVSGRRSPPPRQSPLQMPPGIRYDKVSKILHLKRPHLFPILGSRLLRVYRIAAAAAAVHYRWERPGNSTPVLGSYSRRPHSEGQCRRAGRPASTSAAGRRRAGAKGRRAEQRTPFDVLAW